MKRPFGQHFLFDTNMIRKIIRYSRISSKDLVIEIGPGLGTMTRMIAETAKKVIAVEYDKKLLKKLHHNLEGIPNVELINADALKFPYDTIPGPFKVVSNLPYYISTPLLFRLLQYRDRITSMTLMLQKEVARRIVAQPGHRDYGVLSISVQLFTRSEIGFTVSRKVFSPPPEVDSAVVRFDIFKDPRYKVRDTEAFLSIVKMAFSQRRKTLINSLKSFKGIKEAIECAGIDPSRRPETLGIEDFSRIESCLGKKTCQT